MERGIVRVLVVVALVFLLAGDFAMFLSSTLNMMGLSPNSVNEKSSGGKGTVKGKTSFTDDELDGDEDETLAMIGKTCFPCQYLFIYLFFCQ